MKDTKTFEQALTELEKVVSQLERGETPLEQAIALFDEGMKLANFCGHKLEWAKQKVDVLTRENGEWVKKPLEGQESK